MIGRNVGGSGAAVLVVTLLAWGLLSCSSDAGRVLDEALSEASGASASGPSGGGPSEAPGAPAPPSAPEARSMLDGLAVASEAAGGMAGYSREEFPHWAADGTVYGWPDTEGSCDVRDDALIRDGRGVRVDEECSIISGSWIDPYTGAELSDSEEVDIDHVVPLANAWRSGASAWSASDREAYANDPEALLSADDNANQEKGDKGPEVWRPPNRDYWCEYSRRWVWIKSDWGLTVTEAEAVALDEMLATCAANAAAGA